VAVTELLEAAKRLLDSFRVSQDQWCHNALALIKVTRSRRCPGPSGVVIDRGRQKSEAQSVSVTVAVARADRRFPAGHGPSPFKLLPL
jgi:hypothetical protein